MYPGDKIIKSKLPYIRGGEDRSETEEKQTRNSVFKSTNKTLYNHLSLFSC